MALLDALTTQRPRMLTLFKWVAIIFLVPVLLLAIIPSIVTVIAQSWKIVDVLLITIPLALTVSCFTLVRMKTLKLRRASEQKDAADSPRGSNYDRGTLQRAQQAVTGATWPPPFAAS